MYVYMTMFGPLNFHLLQINEEEGPVMHSIIQNHFQSIRVLKGEKKLKYGHHQAILAISR